jgi:hypothetical protein
MLLAGALPVLAAHLAYAINLANGLEACFPYWDGCMSVSRGLRSGPGLWWFKVLALPSMALMWSCWSRVGMGMERRTRRVAWLTGLGRAGAVFFLVYALWLGTEGDIYRWLRRYGVVFYFGFTGLAQLMLLAAWPQRWRRLAWFRVYVLVVSLAWLSGIASAFKRQLSDDPAFVDRVENALEWHFALYLSLGFVALGLAWRTMRRDSFDRPLVG